MRTHPTNFCSPKRKLIIELDGGQHLEQQEYDTDRTAYLEAKRYSMVHFCNNEVLENIYGIL